VAAFGLAGLTDRQAPAVEAQGGLPYRVSLGQIVRDGTNPVNQSGFVTSAEAAVSGGTVEIEAAVRSNVNGTVVIDIETYDSVGRRIDQQWVDNVPLQAGQTRRVNVDFQLASGGDGPYTVKVGIFEPGPYWGLLLHWNNDAGSFDND
jgi:hypothetical protein